MDKNEQEGRAPSTHQAASVWRKDVSTESLNRFSEGSMVSFLEMKFMEVGPDFMRVRMPVTERTRQPLGILHGGATTALAETAASTAAWSAVDDEHVTIGMEINTNHIRKKDSGWVEAVTRPLHIGRTTHVWEFRVSDETGDLISAGRMTLAVLSRK